MRTKVLGLAATLFALAIGGSAQAATGPAALWHFDEGTGTTVTDNSGNGHDGTLSGGVTWIAGQPGFGSALSFGGGMVTVPSVTTNSSLEPHNAVSVSAWVEASGNPGAYKYLLAKGATSNAASYALYTGASGGIQFYVASDATHFVASPAADPGSVWDGKWHLVVGTWDGSTVRLYLDGNQVGGGTSFSGPINYNPGTALYIGSYPLCVDPEFPGDIDEVGVWDEALSQSDVFSLLSGPYEPPSGGGGGFGGGSGGGGSAGGGSAGGGSPGRPQLSQLRISPSTFAAGFTGSSRDVSRRSHSRRKTGTVVSYNDTQSALTIFTVLAPESGVREGNRCVKGRRHKHSRGCTRYVTLGHFTHSDTAGRNSLRFNGSVSGHVLAPGTYVLEATPRVGTLAGGTLSVTFKITR